MLILFVRCLVFRFCRWRSVNFTRFDVFVSGSACTDSGLGVPTLCLDLR